MRITLERFSQADHQDLFPLLSSVSWFEIQTSILSCLDPRSERRFLHSCLVLYSDRVELLLFATQCRLQLDLSTFAVPTPPVQVYLPVAVGQGGGFWDDVDSDHSQSLAGVSETESENHAVENQHTD